MASGTRGPRESHIWEDGTRISSTGGQYSSLCEGMMDWPKRDSSKSETCSHATCGAINTIKRTLLPKGWSREGSCVTEVVSSSDVAMSLRRTRTEKRGD